MSVYEEKYAVYYRQCFFYTSDPAKALELLDTDPENGAVHEGYGDYRDTVDRDVIEVVRRTIGPVSREQLVELAAEQAAKKAYDETIVALSKPREDHSA